ncbi:hypothetical protein CEP52_011976 [Fusarium oligoseptatum]|uniref:Uncharacterized protein n=1 Tax=Fusarium oligoseptatum TaxID=2604345 RepID=A0A428T0K8_9HYPO|nr:hypothetical protein CEP52_011976 [Fusarium oligoseptatum]
MNGTEARLFISWKQQDLFNVQNVRSFALQEPDHFIEFRNPVPLLSDLGLLLLPKTEIKNMRHDDAAGIKEPTQIPKRPNNSPQPKVYFTPR